MTIQHKLPPEIYFQTVPKRFTSAGGLIFNDREELLIVRTSYKPHWEIPGGITDAGDAHLRQTVVREIREELGIDVVAKALLCIDLKTGREGREGIPDAIHSIFEIEPLSAEQLGAIQLDDEEILEYGFFPVEIALTKLGASLSPRVAQAIEARKNQTVFYLENGVQPFQNLGLKNGN